MFDEHEPAEFEIAADLSAVERQLARLTPAAPRIDRDRLMFEAGRVAARPRWPVYIAEPSRLGRHFWPATTFTMTAASVLLTTMLVWQRQSLQLATQPVAPPIVATQAVDQTPSVVANHAPLPEMTTTGWPTYRPRKNGYLGVRYIALTQGVNAIEPTLSTNIRDRDGKPSSDVLPTQRELLNELLPSSHDATTPRS